MEALKGQEHHPFLQSQIYVIGGTVDVGKMGKGVTTTHTIIDSSAIGEPTFITPTGKLRIVHLQLKAEGGDNTLIVKEDATTMIPTFTLQGGTGYTYNSQWPIKFTTAAAPLKINFSTAERVTGFVITYEE